jgi:hypothetical protein
MSNFEVHLKNRNHRDRVAKRLDMMKRLARKAFVRFKAWVEEDA